MNVYEADVKENGVILDNSMSKGAVQDIQRVVATSEYAEQRGIHVGDLIKINLMNYVKMVPKNKYYKSAQERTLAPDGKQMEAVFVPPVMKLDKEQFLHIEYSDVEYLVQEYKMEKEDNGIIIPENKIIV